MGQGKKSKAKARLDKYWSLAHQEGFRARSAYKLTQLNKKYGFLNRASTVVDLCAAPGGWLQVCQQVMPVTSTIVGVDLYPIKPIPGVKTLVGDITTDKTKKELLRELGGKKAEVVLHDGAPSVGGTWDKDAYVQNVLVLHAARFACQVLQPEGVFVTKVFRSVDYTKILWVFESHFEKVEATKPPSSRNQSAEIFVVCRGYKCPKTLDMKFFDPKHVFEEINAEQGEVRVGMDHDDQGGYEGEIAVGGMRLHGEISVSAFVRSKAPEQMVESMGAITFKAPEDAVYLKNKHTNPEILECCKDLKVLNKTDKVRLLKWRQSLWQDTRALRAKQEREEAAAAEMEASDAESEGDEGEVADTEDSGVDKDTAEINKMKSELDRIQKQKLKQQKKKERKQVNSILQRAQRTNFNPDDDPLNVIATQDKEMFKGLTAEALRARDMEVANANMDVDHMSLASDAQSMMSLGEGSEVGSESDIGSVAGDETGESSYYQRLDRLLDSAYREERYKKVGHREEAPDTDDDVASIASSRGRDEETIAALGKGARWEDSESEMSDASYMDSDDSLDDRPKKKRKDDNGDGRTSKSHKKIGFEEVPKMLRDPERRAQVLAIGTRMLDKGNRRDIIEAGVNRYSFNDDGLPKWFLEDEKKHHYIPLPVTKEEVDQERARFKEINARPARKVLEAMHRKYQRAKRTVQKAAESAKAAGGETLRKKHVPTVRDVLRSKDMRNSHKKKKPLDPKTIGDKKREKHKLAKQVRGKRRRNH